MVQPSLLTQAEGFVGSFECHYPQAFGTDWMINRTALNQLNPRPSGIMAVSNTLNITALPSYNGTEIRCLVTLMDETMQATTELSSKAILQIQGRLLHTIMLAN